MIPPSLIGSWTKKRRYFSTEKSPEYLRLEPEKEVKFMWEGGVVREKLRGERWKGEAPNQNRGQK